MKRIERLTSIITFLQSRNYTSIERLVEKYDVSERTIYRDLVSLHEIGVPITYEQSRGYHILDDHFIPPVSFSEEEAVALTLAGRLMRRFSDNKTNLHFDNALVDILHHLKEMDSVGLYEATGSTSSRVPAGSCCRPPMWFA